MARQKRITTEHGEHYYIDLVFYNYILKCFVVIDLKAGKLTYQDVGQIDFYVRLFDETVKSDDDNPTIGIVLVTDRARALQNTPCLPTTRSCSPLSTGSICRQRKNCGWNCSMSASVLSVSWTTEVTPNEISI